MKILLIDACVRNQSRTRKVAYNLLSKMEGDVTELVLNEEGILPLNRERLEERDHLIQNGLFHNPLFRYARQFADADEIVIAAPYWDLSFPALLKTYLEAITVAGITFRYDNGRPVGLCKAKRLTYVTTAGGQIFQDFGYSYVKALAENLYGIEHVVGYKMENLDVNCVRYEDVLRRPMIKME